MSRRIVPVTISEYLEILELAQEIHKEKDEPIPSFQASKSNELDSCLKTPFTSYMGVLLYKGFIRKASMLFYLLCRNHVLVNGNKRLACLCLSWFCYKNHHNLEIPQDEFYNLAKETVLASEDDKAKTLKKIEKAILKYLQ